jgi:CBS-domain-containing membrane protein
VPFITSIVLVMALPDSLPARPRALIGGHLFSCLAGWLGATLFGPGQIASAVGVGVASLAMIATGTLHPPAGIDAFLIATGTMPADWILNPVLIGTLMLAGFARAWTEGERRCVARLAERGGGR